MKRDQFLKTLGIGALALATPMTIKAKKAIPISEETSFAIDINSITGISGEGSKISPMEIITIWRETGILIYKSRDQIGRPNNPPMVFKGELKAIDLSNKSTK